jgi:imidazolonepropionase
MARAKWDSLWVNATLATMAGGGAPYGAIPAGAIAVKDGRIAWCGPAADLPGRPDALAAEVHDSGGGWITPGLIDCHTHLVYAGNRANEFELRLKGASYAEIARAGGGILSTVKATRAASEEVLRDEAAARARRLLAEGVTTIEIKSGYGLTVEDELKMLRAARGVGAMLPIRVVTTFLGAHALPPEFSDRREAYVDLVCDAMIPAAAKAGLADAVDGFCESIGFTAAEIERVFSAARAHGLPVKLHAEQLSDSKGAVLAARFGALSADHLEYVDEDGIAAMEAAGTVAVLLPGAAYFLRETHMPPVEALRRHKVPMALATDSNPGSSPLTSLLLALNMACTLFRLTPEEALAGVTRNGARALGLADEIGTLEAGKRADFVLWDIASPAELAYRMGDNPCRAVFKDGVAVFGAA